MILSEFNGFCEYLIAHINMEYIYRKNLLLVFNDRLAIVQHVDGEGLGHDSPAIHLDDEER